MAADPSPRRPLVAVILAAGKGTRMRSERPKVLHLAGGRPLLAWVVAAARAAGCDRVVAVIGHGAGEVRREMEREVAAGLELVLQAEQRGTGHALAQARQAVAGEATLLVLSGDVPLISADTLRELVSRVEPADGGGEPAWGAMAVAEPADPGRLGRVIARGGAGDELARIVEAADASADELAVRRINAGIYALPAPAVFEYLDRLTTDNAQGEYYLTTALGAAAAGGRRIALVELADPGEALGVNSRAELAAVHRRLLDRRLAELMEAGVTVLEPARTVVEPGVEVGADTVLHPDVSLTGATAVGPGCTIHQGAWLRDSVLGAGVTIEPYSVLDGARVAEGCRVGPFARLRPGARLEEGARAGNFVEIKAATLGAGAKANHLAYIGDAEVGAGANVGAGAVTCNYDGVAKHRTVIGAGAFVGSDTMLVAPVTVGERATTAAGSVITQDVPPGALGVSRQRQRNVPGWRDRRDRERPRTDDEPKVRKDNEPKES